MDDLTPHADVIQEHREWLDAHGSGFRKKWEDMLAADGEAAIVEACTRKLLGEHVTTVEPADVPGVGGPDFKCRRDGRTFYVEATCVKTDRVTEFTRLQPVYEKGSSQYFQPLTKVIRGECSNKAGQLEKLDAPSLLAVGILHPQASRLCFGKQRAELVLTDQPGYGWGKREGWFTGLQNTSFERPAQADHEKTEPARQFISALLLCGFGADPPVVNGVLHPQPARPFDTRLLPGIEFCQRKQGIAPDEFAAEWVNPQTDRGGEPDGPPPH